MISDWLLNSAQKVLFLTRDTHQNTTDLKELKQEVRALPEETKRLAFEIERLRDANRYERENLSLQLNNTLLQFERRLPPA